MSEWISVEERIPEPLIDVLVHINRIGFYVLSMCPYHDSENLSYWSFPDSWVDIDENDVTHWMPLPEPPEELE